MPRWLTFREKGAPPMVALGPDFDKVSRNPGIIENDLRKRQLIIVFGHVLPVSLRWTRSASDSLLRAERNSILHGKQRADDQ
jgi:hypothetical protein